MKLTIIKGVLLATLAVTNFACKDDLEYSGLVRDNRPAVPVTFPNAKTFGGNPWIDVSVAGGGAIKFDLSIPSSSGRTIKEITRVAAGGTGINAGSLGPTTMAANNSIYSNMPVAGSGTTATFQITLADFTRRYGAAINVAPSANPLAPREIGFIFLVTLDDNTQIVTQQVRARIAP